MTSATAWSVSGASGSVGSRVSSPSAEMSVAASTVSTGRARLARTHARPGRHPPAGGVDVVEDHQLQPSGSATSALGRPPRRSGSATPRNEARCASSATRRVLPKPVPPTTSRASPWVVAASSSARLRARPVPRRGRRSPAPGRAAPPARRWPGRLALEPPVPGEHGQLGGPQLRPRFDPEVLDQPRPGPLVGRERLGLLAQPVQAGDQLGPEPLPVRVLGDQRLQLADERRRGRRGGGGQLRLDPRLHRGQAQFAEAACLGRGERGVGDVGVRLAPPQRQRGPQPPRGQSRLADAQRPAALGHPPLESGDIHDGRFHGQQVSRRPG